MALSTVKCPSCEGSINKGDDFCRYCGWDQSMIVKPEAIVQHELVLNDFYKSLQNTKLEKLYVFL